MQHYTHKSKHRRVVMKKLTVAQKTARRLCCICILLMWILSSKSTPADSLHWTATPYAMSSTQCERQISNTFCSTKMTALSVTRTAHDIHLHSAWSESSAARPRPRGGRRGGEKLASGAFATLQRRGPQGRAHIWGVFSCKGAERDEWRGPKGRADALAIVVLWRKEDRAAKPAGPRRRARFCWRLIKNAKF